MKEMITVDDFSIGFLIWQVFNVTLIVVLIYFLYKVYQLLKNKL